MRTSSRSSGGSLLKDIVSLQCNYTRDQTNRVAKKQGNGIRIETVGREYAVQQ
jgi:hypothetical protein